MTRGSEHEKTIGPETAVQTAPRTAQDTVVDDDRTEIAEDPSDDLRGRVIANKYRLMIRVGKGGMGSVYEAVHLQTERRTAVKILNKELSKDLKVVARFRREAMAASRLNHENCVAVYDFGEDDDGTFYISMEFVDGAGLGTELRRLGHAFAPDRVIRIGTQILAALDAAHAAGIIHRDLKPQNVMVTSLAGRTDFVKVVDFGIAKFVDHHDAGLALTMPGTIFGTPEYMSPEQARGEELDGRSDVYSAAVVLWHMLLGRSPFRGQNVRETLMNVFQLQPPRPSDERPEDAIPRGLEDALLRAMEKDPNRRTQSPAALLSELLAFAQESSSPGRPAPRLPTPGLVEGSAPPETLPADYLADGTRRPTAIAHGGLASGGQAPKVPQKKGPIGPPLPELAVEANDRLLEGVVAPPPIAPPIAPPPAAVAPPPAAPPPVVTPVGPEVETRTLPDPVPASAPSRPPTKTQKKAPSSVPLVAAIGFALFAAMVVGGLAVVIIDRVAFSGPTTGRVDPPPSPVVQTPIHDDNPPPATPEGIIAEPDAPRAGGIDRRAFEAAISRAEIALAKEDLAGAATGYGEAIAIDPGNTKAHKGLALVAYRQGDLDLAKQHLEWILNEDPESARQVFGFHAIVKKKIQDGK